MANDSVEFSLIGLGELLGKLDAIDDDLRFKGGRFAARKSANIIRDAAKANAKRIDDPATAEDIDENIAVRFSRRTFKRTGNIKFRIGVRGGARNYGDTKQNRRARRVGQSYTTGGSSSNPGGDTWYWRLVEFGTSHSRAQPFLRPAIANNIGKATDEFVRQYGRSIDRAIKKARKRQGFD